jgi:hypothetical protein
MPTDLEFVLGLLDRSYPAFVSQDDFLGPHASMLRLWQRMGFLAADPEPHPAPSCPYCLAGVPISIGAILLYGRCLSRVDPGHLLRWRFDLDAFLRWLAVSLGLQGDVQRLDQALWQLGNFADERGMTACFFSRGTLSEHGRLRLTAYRRVLLLRALPGADMPEDFRGPCVSLLDVVRMERDTLAVASLTQILFAPGTVRFDVASGALWAGDTWLGEVPVGSKEHSFLACLARSLDRFVPYADIKHEVLRLSGSRDTTDEATFCQKLKGRIKRKWVPEIDRLIATTNKADGYRLRGHVEPWQNG